MLIAQYNENHTLENVKIEEFTVSKEGGILSPDPVTQNLDPEATYCKVYIWSSTGAITPLVGEITISDIK